MNTQHDELEALLGAGLRDRAGDADGSWLELEDVRGRATSIRRRRRAVAGVGVAAALAIIAPLALTLGGSLDTDREIQPAPPTPSEVVRTRLTLDGLERGDAPGIEYFTPDGVVLPDGTTQPLDASWQALVRSEADGGWLALSPSKDEVVDLTEDFQRTSARTVTQTFVSNPDRSLVAWTFPEPGAQTLTLHSTTDPEGDTVWQFPATPVVDPVDFVGDDSLLFQTTAPDGTHDNIGIANADGTTTMLDGGYTTALAADPTTGHVAVVTRVRADNSTCSAVVDPAQDGGAAIWETCDYLLGGFSPDGRYVLATDSQQSGLGQTSLTVLDAATGDPVASFRQVRRGQLALVGVAWESADSVVAVATEANTTTILRLGVDGTLEQTTDGVGGDSFADLPFYLGVDRRRGLF